MTRKNMILTTIVSFFALLTGYFSFKKNSSYYRVNYKSLDDLNVLIAEIAEVILPSTDSPGAKDARVADYIIKVVGNCFGEKERTNFIRGLEAVQSYSLRLYSVDFEGCDLSSKMSVIQYFESKDFASNSLLKKIKTKLLGRSFFEEMKDLVVSGYCTSELGATKGLAYDYIPINYLSCVPYLKYQKSWATK